MAIAVADVLDVARIQADDDDDAWLGPAIVAADVVMVAAGENVYCMPPPGKEAPVLSLALDQLVHEGLLEQVIERLRC